MKVDIKKLVKEDLQLEGYFILYCLHFKKQDVLVDYLKNVLKIGKPVFESIIEDGYLEYFGDDGGDYTLDNIQITSKFGKVFFKEVDEEEGLTFDAAFEELRMVYPKKTPDGRRLHVDNERAKRYYKASIVAFNRVNKKHHKHILECVKFMVKEETNNGKLMYLKQLPAYINAKMWQSVEDDVKKITESGGSVDIVTNTENKTVMGKEEF